MLDGGVKWQKYAHNSYSFCPLKAAGKYAENVKTSLTYLMRSNRLNRHYKVIRVNSFVLERAETPGRWPR